MDAADPSDDGLPGRDEGGWAAEGEAVGAAAPSTDLSEPEGEELGLEDAEGGAGTNADGPRDPLAGVIAVDGDSAAINEADGADDDDELSDAGGLAGDEVMGCAIADVAAVVMLLGLVAGDGGPMRCGMESEEAIAAAEAEDSWCELWLLLLPSSSGTEASMSCTDLASSSRRRRCSLTTAVRRLSSATTSAVASWNSGYTESSASTERSPAVALTIREGMARSGRWGGDSASRCSLSCSEGVGDVRLAL